MSSTILQAKIITTKRHIEIIMGRRRDGELKTTTAQRETGKTGAREGATPASGATPDPCIRSDL